MVVGHEQKEIIRSHVDLEKDNCKHHKKACKVPSPPQLPPDTCQKMSLIAQRTTEIFIYM